MYMLPAHGMLITTDTLDGVTPILTTGRMPQVALVTLATAVVIITPVVHLQRFTNTTLIGQFTDLICKMSYRVVRL